MTQIIDLYSTDNEGDWETILLEKDASDTIVTELKLFTGDFKTVINHIPFNKSLHPASLVYLINTDLDWGDYLSEITRVEEFLDQLQQVGPEMDAPFVPHYNALKYICRSALQNSNRLFIIFE